MADRIETIALLTASLTLTAAVGVSAVAYARDRGLMAQSADGVACEPGRCTIVVKTAAGGPPSEVRTLEAPAPASSAPVRANGGWAIASREVSGSVGPIRW